MDFYRTLRSANIISNLFNKKIGKIILFVVLFGLLFVLFNSGVFAVDYEVDLSTIDNATINSGQVVSGSSNDHICYFQTKSNCVYTVSMSFASGHPLYLCVGEPSVGSSVTSLVIIEPGDTYTFVGNEKYYLTSFTGSINDRITVTYNYVSGSDGAIDDLVDTITLQNLWQQNYILISLLGLAVLFSLGYVIVKRLSGGTSKAKVKF